jgi:ABC-type uncharacterized transport system involved in gliding motility auxiliary subunit
MTNGTLQSFSGSRKWNASLNVALSLVAVLALVLMVNYLAARHFRRATLASSQRTELSPLTKEVLASLTNDIKVTVYYDRGEPLYESVWSLLKEYAFANSRIQVDVVDYTRDPGAAQLAKANYKLSLPTDKNLVIFDCSGRPNPKVVYQSDLSDLDLQDLIAGKSKEVRRTHFKGEMLFTSAILSVTSPRSLKAYFLQGHGEHQPESEDKLMGYSEFAAVLRENNIQVDKLNLAGTAEVPPDCHLLIIAGPVNPLLTEELDKIGRYLRQGGRLFALFNFNSAEKPLGLEELLGNWGVAVGDNVVFDKDNSFTGKDMVVSHFASHPITRPLYQSGIYVVLPRSVGKLRGGSPGADGSAVEPIAFTGPRGHVVTDVRKGDFYATARDTIGTVPLVTAVEKGKLSGVTADRGATRLVVCGESIFLGNETIHKAANRDFASLAVNWLLDRSQLVNAIGPRPIKEYRLNMTKRQMVTARWLLMVGLPGAVLLLGFLMSVRRRK